MSFRIALALAALALLFSTPARAEERVWHHALSLVGTPKYGPDFKSFDWVNPDAPKGGTVVTYELGPFDTLNPYPPQSNSAPGLGLIADELMAGSLDEPSTAYGLVAEAVTFPADYSSVTFRLRPEARFHDGKPITPEDVIWSLEALRKVNPFYNQYYKDVTSAEATGAHEVTIRFGVKGNRELPHILGQLPVLPKHHWTGKNARGEVRDLARSTTEPPLGSGPYRIKSVDPGRSITYERVKDYWAKDLAVYRGFWNFDEIKYIAFYDQTPAFEAFKSGTLNFYQETSAKNWATAYDFPAFGKGLVKKEKIDMKQPEPMQGWVFNQRRAKFKDPRVRRAFNLAFNFEWANKSLFYGLYTRTDSYFENQEDLASSGLPEGLELEILNSVKADGIPPEVFTAPYTNPVNTSEESFRKHLLEAVDLLKQAGWSIKGGVLTNDKTGERMQVEFLLADQAFARIVNPYREALGKWLGIQSSVRVVDPAQYVNRVTGFDFDIVTQTIGQSDSPGNEQRNFWGSAAADTTGSRNFMGLKSPAVDKLVDRIIFAKDRAELVAATRALDRVLLWGHNLVPQWHAPYERVAYWDFLRRPEKTPSRDLGVLAIWWIDKDAQARIEAARTQ
jgi:microcin C transport system substrate-binding protein